MDIAPYETVDSCWVSSVPKRIVVNTHKQSSAKSSAEFPKLKLEIENVSFISLPAGTRVSVLIRSDNGQVLYQAAETVYPPAPSTVVFENVSTPPKSVSLEIFSRKKLIASTASPVPWPCAPTVTASVYPNMFVERDIVLKSVVVGTISLSLEWLGVRGHSELKSVVVDPPPPPSRPPDVSPERLLVKGWVEIPQSIAADLPSLLQRYVIRAKNITSQIEEWNPKIPSLTILFNIFLAKLAVMLDGSRNQPREGPGIRVATKSISDGETRYSLFIHFVQGDVVQRTKIRPGTISEIPLTERDYEIFFALAEESEKSSPANSPSRSSRLSPVADHKYVGRDVINLKEASESTLTGALDFGSQQVPVELTLSPHLVRERSEWIKATLPIGIGETTDFFILHSIQWMQRFSRWRPVALCQLLKGDVVSISALVNQSIEVPHISETSIYGMIRDVFAFPNIECPLMDIEGPWLTANEIFEFKKANSKSKCALAVAVLRSMGVQDAYLGLVEWPFGRLGFCVIFGTTVWAPEYPGECMHAVQQIATIVGSDNVFVNISNLCPVDFIRAVTEGHSETSKLFHDAEKEAFLRNIVEISARVPMMEGMPRELLTDYEQNIVFEFINLIKEEYPQSRFVPWSSGQSVLQTLISGNNADATDRRIIYMHHSSGELHDIDLLNLLWRNIVLAPQGGFGVNCGIQPVFNFYVIHILFSYC